MAKRFFDFILAFGGLIVLAPVFLFVAIVIKLESRGPVFYAAKRIGRDGKTFRMFKFRTMVDAPVDVGPRVSPGNDPRVTRLGRFLRRSKLNELPQLYNVLIGDMGFVGPRPEDPSIVELYTPEQRRVLGVRPGIVGPNQILGRNEEDMYPPGVDPLKFYLEHILPPKMEIDLEYVENPTFFGDVKYLIRGVGVTLTGSITRRHIFENPSQILLMTGDIACFVFSLFASYMVVPGREISPMEHSGVLYPFLFVIVARMIMAQVMGVYTVLVRFLDLRDLIRLVQSMSWASLIAMAVTTPWVHEPFWIRLLLIDWLVCIVLMAGIRLFAVLLRSRLKRRSSYNVRHVLIYGAGRTGELALRRLESQESELIEVVGLIDDNPEMRHRRLLNRTVLGDRHDLEVLMKLYHVDELIIAVGDSFPSSRLRRLVRQCAQIGLRVRRFQSSIVGAEGMIPGGTVRPTGIADWIGYESASVDLASIAPCVAGRCILITGAGSAVSTQLARLLSAMGVAQLVLWDHDEGSLADAVISLGAQRPSCLVTPVLASTSPSTSYDRLFQRFDPDLVIHTGLIRPSPFLKPSIDEAIRTNVLGTCALLKAAQSCGVKDLIVLTSDLRESTDWITGVTMRTVEARVRNMSQVPIRTYAVRHMEVLERRAGPIRVFEEALRRNEVIDFAALPRMQWCLPAEEAARLVLSTLDFAQSGSVYRITAGKEFDMYELMVEAAQLSGLPPNIVPVFEKSLTPPGMPNANVTQSERERECDLDSVVEILPPENWSDEDFEKEVELLRSLTSEPFELTHAEAK